MRAAKIVHVTSSQLACRWPSSSDDDALGFQVARTRVVAVCSDSPFFVRYNQFANEIATVLLFVFESAAHGRVFARKLALTQREVWKPSQPPWKFPAGRTAATFAKQGHRFIVWLHGELRLHRSFRFLHNFVETLASSVTTAQVCLDLVQLTRVLAEFVGHAPIHSRACCGTFVERRDIWHLDKH